MFNSYKLYILIITLCLLTIGCSDNKSDAPVPTTQEIESDEHEDTANEIQQSEESQNNKKIEKTDQTQIKKTANEITEEIIARANGNSSTQNSNSGALKELEREFQKKIKEIAQRLKERKQQVNDYLETKLSGLLNVSIQDQENLSDKEIIQKFISLTIPEAPLHTDEGIKALAKKQINEYLKNEVFNSTVNLQQIESQIKIKKITQSPDSLLKDDSLVPNSKKFYEKFTQSDSIKPVVLSDNLSSNKFNYNLINDVSGVKTQANGELTVDIFLEENTRISIKNINIFIAESKNLLIAESNGQQHPALFQAISVTYDPNNAIVEHYPNRSETKKFASQIKDKIMPLKEHTLEHSGAFVVQKQNLASNQNSSVSNPHAYNPNLPDPDANLMTKIKTTITGWLKKDDVPRMRVVEEEINNMQNAYLQYRESYLIDVKNKLDSIKELSEVDENKESLLTKIKTEVDEDIKQLHKATENRYDLLIEEINKNFEKMDNYTEKMKTEKQKFISMLQEEKKKRQSQIEAQFNTFINEVTSSEVYQQQKNQIEDLFNRISNAVNPEGAEQDKESQ